MSTSEEPEDVAESSPRLPEPKCARPSCGHERRFHPRWVWKDDSRRTYTGAHGMPMNCIVAMKPATPDGPIGKCPCPQFVPPLDDGTPTQENPIMASGFRGEDPEPGDDRELEECARDPMAKIEEDVD